jgi:hypothetical protein
MQYRLVARIASLYEADFPSAIHNHDGRNVSDLVAGADFAADIQQDRKRNFASGQAQKLLQSRSIYADSQETKADLVLPHG